jgi:hypothetical protein
MKFSLAHVFVSQLFAAKYEEFTKAIKSDFMANKVVSPEQKSVSCCFGTITYTTRSNKQLNKAALLELIGSLSTEQLAQAIEKVDADFLGKVLGKDKVSQLFFEGIPTVSLTVKASDEAKEFLERVFVENDPTVDVDGIVDRFQNMKKSA